MTTHTEPARAAAAPVPAVRPEHFCRWGTCPGCIWSRDGGCALPPAADAVPPHVILEALFSLPATGLARLARRDGEGRNA